MLAFVVSVPVDDLDVASELMWRLGVRGIEERGGPSEIELWTVVGDDPVAIQRAGDLLDRWSWRTEDVDESSADTWRDHAGPMWVDDHVVLVPAWQQHHLPDDVMAIRVEPGGAFGLGDHPTTMLSLRALRLLPLADASVLDVGCGTGVLAIGAALFGARSVRAVDIADAAVEATRANAERNGVADRIGVDPTPIAVLYDSFDVVVANILAPTLCELADDLSRLTTRNGRLVISGVLAESHGHVIAALAPMVVEATTTLDGWAAITLRHPDGG